MVADRGLEAALATTEDQLDVAIRAAAGLSRELKKAKAGAANGQLRDLRRSLASVATLGDEAARAAHEAAQSFDLDEQEHLASGAFAKELLEAAAEWDVSMVEEDDRLLCYPSLLKILPADSAVDIDRRRERRVRPSVLLRVLKAAQARPPRFVPAPYLESLATAYDLTRARDGSGAVVRVVDLWAVLTLLPGQEREYTRPEFARDLYLLDKTGVRTTKSGRTLRWHASSGTRGAGVLTTVAESGQRQLYWAISFTDAS